MSDNQRPERPELDDRLADFTDQLFSGQEPELAGDDSELRQLQEAVLHLYQAQPEKRPSAAMQARIAARLAQRLRQQQREVKGQTGVQPPGWWQKLWKRPSAWQSTRGRQRWRVAALVASLAAVLLLSLPLLSEPGSSLPGTAVGNQSSGFVAAIVIVALAGGFIWWWRNR